MNNYLAVCLLLLVLMNVVFMRVSVKKLDLDWAVFAKLTFWGYVGLLLLNFNQLHDNYAVAVVVGLSIWIYHDMQNTIYDIEDAIAIYNERKESQDGLS